MEIFITGILGGLMTYVIFYLAIWLYSAFFGGKTTGKDGGAPADKD